ncbi:MAG: ferritin family protein [Burkholderiales bacterium]|nr:ferritin family protein [Burkholderiales bacterium]
MPTTDHAMDYSLPVFLAHALAMEREAAERYLELADMMEAHRNDAVAALFRDMVRYSRMHHDSIAARAGSLPLPPLRPAEYRWRRPPEAGGEEAFDYTLDPYRALRYARENEVRAMEYYTAVGLAAADPEVRRLAAEFAAEETEHVDALDDWLARTGRPSAPWRDDPEP